MIRPFATLALALTAAAPVAGSSPSVVTTGGPVTGAVEADGTIAFRGIPYARPPVGPAALETTATDSLEQPARRDRLGTAVRARRLRRMEPGGG